MMCDANYPCVDCTERTVSCHAACERYLTARATRDALRDEEHKIRVGDSAARDLLADGIVKSIRRNGRK